MKSTYHYYKYFFVIQKSKMVYVILDLLFFILSLVFTFDKFIQNNNWNIKFILLTLLSAVKLAYSLKKFLNKNKYFKREFKGATIKRRFDDFSSIIPSEKEKNNGFKPLNIKQANYVDVVFYSDEINTKVQSEKINIEISSEKLSKIRTKIKERKNVLWPLFKHKRRTTKQKGQNFFNEDKLCLSTDIEINNNTVSCHKGGYFDSYLTNECYGKCLFSGISSDLKLADAFDYFPVQKIKDKYQLKEISSALLNNHIGISTLAFTSDNYLILMNQNALNIQDPGALVPSGSGSLDYSDLDTENYSLQKTITNGMERELTEENSLDEKAKILQTVILGFFRWVKRAGKPEFVGITKLDNKLNELEANKSEVSHAEHIHIHKIEDLIEGFRKIRETARVISTPLQMNMLFLENFCNNENNQTVLNEIFNIKN